jgi:hypothetical protein
MHQPGTGPAREEEDLFVSLLHRHYSAKREESRDEESFLFGFHKTERNREYFLQ